MRVGFIIHDLQGKGITERELKVVSDQNIRFVQEASKIILSLLITYPTTGDDFQLSIADKLFQ